MTSTAPSSLLVRGGAAPDSDGRVVNITAASAGWRHVAFQTFRLRRGQHLVRRSVGDEACVVILSGRCRAQAAGKDWPEVGGRPTPFDGPPHALYVPVGVECALQALEDSVELAIGPAPVSSPTQAREPRLIKPADVRVSTRGSGSMERTIHDILME